MNVSARGAVAAKVPGEKVANLTAAAEYTIPSGQVLVAVNFQDALYELQILHGVTWQKTDHTWTPDEWTLVDNILSDGTNVKLVNGAGTTKQYRIRIEE